MENKIQEFFEGYGVKNIDWEGYKKEMQRLMKGEYVAEDMPIDALLEEIAEVYANGYTDLEISSHQTKSGNPETINLLHYFN